MDTQIKILVVNYYPLAIKGITSAAFFQNNRTTNELREKEEGASHPKKPKPWVKPTLKVKKRKDWTKAETQAVSGIRTQSIH